MLGRFLFLQVVLASIAVTADGFNQGVLGSKSARIARRLSLPSASGRSLQGAPPSRG